MNVTVVASTSAFEVPIDERKIREYDFEWLGCPVVPESLIEALQARTDPIMDLWNYEYQGRRVDRCLLLEILGWREGLTPCSSMHLEDAARKLRKLDGYKATISRLPLPEHASIVISVGQGNQVIYIRLLYRNSCDRYVLSK
jgi:hypothetical protein